MSYKAKTETRTYQTRHRLEFINITADVERFVHDSGIRSGTVTLQTHHTTCGLWVNEDEKNLIGPRESLGYVPDLQRVLDRFAHPSEEYNHNDILDARNPSGKRNTHLCMPDENGIIQECINGHSHAHNMLLQSYLTLIGDVEREKCNSTLLHFRAEEPKRGLMPFIIEHGHPLLGQWQQILLVELDHDRPRSVTMLAQGDA